MKKIFIAMVVVLCAVQVADAQVKSAAKVKKEVEKAEETVANPKKAEDVTSWLKLGNAYVEAANNPKGAGWIGANRQELVVVLGNDKPSSSEYVTFGGQSFTKDVYATRNYYFDEFDVLQIIEVTNPIYEDALLRALDAYAKAYEYDVKGSKTKDLTDAVRKIAETLKDEAFQKYMLGNMVGAYAYFDSAAKAAAQAPLCEIDSLSIYNTGFIAADLGMTQKAQECFEKCLEIGYYEDGEAFARLANVYLKLGNADKAIETLEDGFMNYPESQYILSSLINLYMVSDKDPEKLFGYIAQAKANEPDNASLYYVEGEIYKNLGDTEKALACYNEASEINNGYEFGYIGAAILYLDEYNSLRDKAMEADDEGDYATADEILSEAIQKLMLSAENFDVAFNLTEEDETKSQLADQLKQIYFVLRTQSDEYMVAYEKYNDIVNNGL